MRFFAKLALSIMFSSAFTAAQAIPSLTPEQWIQDLRHFADQIRAEHRDPYHRISKARARDENWPA